MNVRKKSNIAIFTLCVCALTYLSFNCVGRKGETVRVNLAGKALSVYTGNVMLIDSASNMIDPSNFSGSIFLLEFYNNDCAVCAERMKAWRKLMSSVYMKSPVTVVMIHDGASVDFEQFAANIDRKNFSLYDVDGVFAKNLQIDAFPASVLVDRDGVIRHFSIGEETDVKQFVEESRMRIDSLLGGKPGNQ